MRDARTRTVLTLIGFVSCGLILAGQQAAPAAGRYTAAQAAAGRTTYQAQCSACHQPDLKGQGDAAQLAGSEFIDAWGRRTTRELLSFMQLTMPPARPGGLSPEEYASVAAFILQSNSAAAGNQPLTAIQSRHQHHRQRQAPAVAAQGRRGATPAPPQAAEDRRGRRRSSDGRRRGQNYVPVTDAMLRNPDRAIG